MSEKPKSEIEKSESKKDANQKDNASAPKESVVESKVENKTETKTGNPATVIETSETETKVVSNTAKDTK